MKYRLAWFCGIVHLEDYQAWVKDAKAACMNEDYVKMLYSMLAVYEQARKQHHRCIFCSEKLPKSRTSTIG